MAELSPQARYFHVLQCKGALEIEVRTGMKFSNKGSILALCRQLGYTDKRNKKAALADLVKLAEKMRNGTA